MSQIQFQNVSFAIGEQQLLDQISFAVEKRDRIAVIGRNGAGKSTLLKLIQQIYHPDSGQIQWAQGLRVAALPQEVPQNLSGTAYEYVLSQGQDCQDYQIERVLSQLDIDPGLLLIKASGGQIRRVLLAAALVLEPDVLLLDEPTNHLDIDSIIWLEKFLKNYPSTLIFITHDRVFMQNIATRIFELELGECHTWEGSYQAYLKHKSIEQAGLERAQKNFDKKLAEEEKWIRQGIKARRTRNEGRVRALKKMREERAARRTTPGRLTAVNKESTVASKILFELEDVTVQYADKMIIDHFSSVIMRGDKVGIIGPNGAGKSTLIKLLLGDIQPTSGIVKQGAQLDIAYFDQFRNELDLNMTAIENVAGGSEQVVVNNQTKHIIGYLQEFLFTPQKARSLVKTFSGGERNRLLLAKLLVKPSSILILDEPTNDLDIETLEFLEEFLLNYAGAVIIVSHDRALLNEVVTSTIVFEGAGQWKEYVGGYDDWLRQKTPTTVPAKKESSEKNISLAPKKNIKKLSFKEQTELKALPEKIHQVENEIAELQQAMLSSNFYQQAPAVVADKQKKLSSLQTELEKLYARWEFLED